MAVIDYTLNKIKEADLQLFKGIKMGESKKESFFSGNIQ